MFNMDIAPKTSKIYFAVVIRAYNCKVLGKPCRNFTTHPNH